MALNEATADDGTMVSSDEYRNLMSAFPTGVAVVTTTDRAGRPWGMTCTSLTSVTLRPPTLLISLHEGSATLDAIRERGAFAVNLLHTRAVKSAEVFSNPVRDRFARVRWLPSRSGLPWLVDDAFSLAECLVNRSVTESDHIVVFGRVRHVSVGAGAPLLYGLRRYSFLTPPPQD